VAEPQFRVALVRGPSAGGIDRHVRSLATALRALGLRIDVVTPRDRRLAVLRAADLVHTHGLKATVIAGQMAARAAPHVATWHNPPPRTRLGRLVARGAAREADVTLAVSNDLADTARGFGARDVRLMPVPAAPLPEPSRDPAAVRAELGAGDRPLVLAVCRLAHQKGLDILVRAAGTLAARPAAPLVAIAGVGPKERELRALVEATRAPVRLLGWREDVADLLAAADVVVLPSRWEGSPLAAQEALRFGRPLVATTAGGVPDLVGDAALLVPPEDERALADGIDQLLADPGAAAELAARAARRAAGWPTVHDYAAAVAALYGQLLER
jgi:glycosyltransferase involved in cell wall biosynthesis